MLSHRLWESRFAGDPGVVGTRVSLDGKSCVVIGVMPPGFVFPGGTGLLYGGVLVNPAVDLWRPLALDSQTWQARSWHEWQVIGRLKPGVSLAGLGYRRWSQ